MTVFTSPKLVVVESPYRATAYYTQEQHHLYLMHCIEDCLRRGEAPYASHHLIPEILDDDDQFERAFGIRCGFAWGQHADLVAIYSDLGVGPGMADAIEHWSRLGKRIEWRKLPDKVVASIKKYGEFTQEEPLDESSTLGIYSPAVSFADR
jgi:hypothetical protein